MTPPFEDQLDPAVREVWLYLGEGGAWRRANRDHSARMPKSVVIEPYKRYNLSLMAGRVGLIVAVDGTPRSEVLRLAKDCLLAGAIEVCAISETGTYHRFIREAA